MDLDGDRKQDIVLGPNSNGEWFELQSTGSGFVDKGLLISGAYGAFATTNEGIACIRVMDVSGDGLQDIVLGPDGNGNWYVLVSTGKSLADSGAWITGAYANWRSLPSQIRAMDINGDGRQDILIGPYDNGQWFALKAEADHFTNLGSILNSSYGAWSSSADRIRLMDLDGEGMADIVLGPYDNGQWFTIHSNGIQGKINEMANGTGATTAITYKPLTDSSVYTKDSGSNGSSYPRLDLQMPLYVVSSVTSANGIGGVVTTNYRYGGLKAELGTGRGLLGFRWIDATQVDTGITTHTEYRQDFPYTGMVSLVKKTLPGAGNGGLLSQASTTYGCLNPADGSACVIGVGKRYFPYASQGTEASWDLNGAALPTISTASDYDLWGNPVQITVSSSDGYGKSTTNRYTNDESSWLLGRLTNATVTSTTP